MQREYGALDRYVGGDDGNVETKLSARLVPSSAECVLVCKVETLISTGNSVLAMIWIVPKRCAPGRCRIRRAPTGFKCSRCCSPWAGGEVPSIA